MCQAVRSLLSVSVLWFFTASLVGATPVKLDDAVETLAALESQVGVVKYRVSVRHVDSRKSNSTGGGETRCDGEVLFDFQVRKYRIIRTTVMEWVGNNIGATHGAMRSAGAFDGKTYRVWKQSKPGQEIPELGKWPIVGAIDRVIEPGETLEVMMRSVGLNHCFPFVENGSPVVATLSALLREQRKRKLPTDIHDIGDGTWQLTLEGPDKEKIRIVVNIARGGLWEKIEAEIKGQPFWSGSAELEKVADGVWYPKTIHWKSSSFVSHFQITDCVVNPKVTDRDYHIDFPVGTQVDDRIERKFYVVSGGPIDETKAIEQFIARHGLRPEDARRGTSYWVLLAYGLAFTLLIGLGVWLRRARVLVLLTVLFAPAASRAGELVAETQFAFRDPSDVRNIRQCGFTVSVFALKWFDVEFDSNVLMNALSPTNSGVKLLVVKQVLEAHGLSVEEREKVTLRNLCDGLPRDCLAVVSVAGKSKVKHLVLALWQRDEVLCVDPPTRIAPFGKVYSEEGLLAGGSIALLVRKPTDNENVAEHARADAVAVIPHKLDFGNLIASSDAEPVKKHVTIRNLGPTPLLLAGVESSCGCTVVDWEGGLLFEREERRIEVSVRPAAWGVGRMERQVKLKFANGLRHQFGVMGTGASAELLQKLTLSSNHCRIEVTRADIAKGRSSPIELFVDHEAQDKGSLEVVCTANWLKCEMNPVSDRRTKLTLQGVFDDAIKESLRTQPEGVGCDILVSAKRGLEPVRVQVEITRKTFVSIHPRVARLHRDGSQVGTIVVSLDDDGPPLQLKSTNVRPDDIEVNLESQTETELRFRVRTMALVLNSVHVVTLKVASGDDETDAAFVVQTVSENSNSDAHDKHSTK